MKLTLEKAQKIMERNGGNLDLKWKQVESLPDNLIVQGDLDVYNCSIRSLPKGLVVYGSLNISKTLIEELPEDLIVGKNVEANNTPLRKLPGNFVVPGYLDVTCTPLKILSDNLVVGNSLYLQKTNLEELPAGLVVGQSLDIRKTLITTLPEDVIVNERVYSDRLKSASLKRNRLRSGDYVEGRYIYANGILTEVEYAYKEKECTVYVGRLKGRNVVSYGVYYVQCNNVEEGIDEIRSKTITALDIVQYKNLTLDSEVELNDAITMYCVITGVKRQETDKFVSSIKNLKNKYVIRELIMLTKGQYGSKQFAGFFEK